MTDEAMGRGPVHDPIRSMLEARADRLRPRPFEVPSLIADVPQATTRSGWLGTFAPRLSVAAIAAVVVLVAAAVVTGPLLLLPAGSEGPSASRSEVASPEGSTAAPETVRMLTAAELGDLARTRSAELGSRLAAVRGALTIAFDPRCSGAACATATLNGAGEGVVLRLGPDFFDLGVGSGTMNGAYVVRFTAERDRDRPVVDVLGRLITEHADSFTSSVHQLIAEDPGRTGSYAAVDGWLVRSAFHPCPSYVVPTIYGCPTDEYLTDEAFQPMRPDGSSVGPAKSIYMPAGSYQNWAPDPLADPDGGVAPRRAVYLLQKQRASGCAGSDGDCRMLASQWGMIAGRLDPIPPVPPGSPPPSRAPSQSPIATASGDPWTVAVLLGSKYESAADYLVRGWLVATPPLRCLSRPVPYGLPDYGCDEVDWLTDEAFQPWVTKPQGAEVRAPEVGMRVQNGAYAAFAPSPGFGEPGGGREPRLGTWIVRFGIRSTCEYAQLDPDVACAGGPFFTWEVIRRL